MNNVRIQMTYKLRGETKTFGCVGWNIFNDWLPYPSTEPVEMTVTENGKTMTYTKFETSRGERCGADFLKIKPLA